MVHTRTFGGFIGWETPSPTQRPMAGELLASGRACLALYLQEHRPRHLWLPFLVCDSVLQPLHEAGVAPRFYGYTAELMPDTRGMELDDAPILALDQYGIRHTEVMHMVARFGKRVIVDHTHGLYDPLPQGQWAFCSIRKWFGIADGALLQAPTGTTIPEDRNTDYLLDHLALRHTGSGPDALDAYRRNNALMSTKPRRISLVAERSLLHTDTEAAQQRRKANFAILHAALGHNNRLPMDLATVHGAICYPYLPSEPLALERLHAVGIFAPRYWPEVLLRPDPSGLFERERHWVRDVLCLPVDQRYGEGDIAEILLRLATLK